MPQVPNTPRRVRGRLQPKPDSTLQEAVAAFLQDVKATLPELRRSGSDPEHFYPAAEALIDSLLQRDAAGRLARIGLFRQPDEPGPLSDIQLLQDARPRLQDLVYKYATHTHTHTLCTTAVLPESIARSFPCLSVSLKRPSRRELQSGDTVMGSTKHS